MTGHDSCLGEARRGETENKPTRWSAEQLEEGRAAKPREKLSAVSYVLRELHRLLHGPLPGPARSLAPGSVVSVTESQRVWRHVQITHVSSFSRDARTHITIQVLEHMCCDVAAAAGPTADSDGARASGEGGSSR
eukprot:2715423-Rhodomonas_salina.1